jgi:hypothetical protein
VLEKSSSKITSGFTWESNCSIPFSDQRPLELTIFDRTEMVRHISAFELHQPIKPLDFLLYLLNVATL